MQFTFITPTHTEQAFRAELATSGRRGVAFGPVLFGYGVGVAIFF